MIENTRSSQIATLTPLTGALVRYDPLHSQHNISHGLMPDAPLSATILDQVIAGVNKHAVHWPPRQFERFFALRDKVDSSLVGRKVEIRIDVNDRPYAILPGGKINPLTPMPIAQRATQDWKKDWGRDSSKPIEGKKACALPPEIWNGPIAHYLDTASLSKLARVNKTFTKVLQQELIAKQFTTLTQKKLPIIDVVVIIDRFLENLSGGKASAPTLNSLWAAIQKDSLFLEDGHTAQVLDKYLAAPRGPQSKAVALGGAALVLNRATYRSSMADSMLERILEEAKELP